MSADNWTVCPRCEDQRRSLIAAALADVERAYGTVPVAEFDRMRAAAGEMSAASPEHTFREDYEFYGASEGTVGYVYKGRCSVCSLECVVEGSKSFYVPLVASTEVKP